MQKIAVLEITNEDGDLIGIVHNSMKNRERVFYSVDKMDDDELINLINKGKIINDNV